MTHRFAEMMFTPTVKSVQERLGSRGAYEAFEEPDAPARDRLGDNERAFIAARSSFYMATVSETGWPYVQHRGGPPGFLKVLDDRTLGFADYRGNRQYVSVGNLLMDDRVSLFLMDYPNRRRLKILGHARIIDLKAEPEIIQRLRDLDYDARIERGMIISLEGFDWNCPQHITPRFTEAEVREQIAPLLSRLKSAEAQLERSCFGGGSVQSLGQGPLELVVTGVRQLTPRIRLYELEDPEGKDLPPAAPGSHLTVPVHLPDGSETVRSYSIASDPARRDVYEIAVLRDDNGRGGSAAVHRDYVVGLRLRCGAPKNAFPLHEDDSPAILIAGGVGITPIRAMAYELARSGREFRLHFAARSAREAAFRSELAETLRDRVTFYFESEILDVDRVLDEAGVQGMVYVCGPEGLIQAVVSRGRERGWPEQRVRYERFAALASSGRNEPFELVLRKSKRRVPVAPGESALDALECAGVPVVSSCRTGTCGTCVVRVLSGEPEHRDSVLSPEERAAGRFTTCVSRSRSPELDLDL